MGHITRKRVYFGGFLGLYFKLGLVLTAAVALSACVPVPLQTDSVTESWRVNSINVVVTDEEDDFFKAIGSPLKSFPQDIGLTQSKIASDFASALRREIIPASKSGERSVDVTIRITSISLLNNSLRFGTSIWAQIYVTDGVGGETLISKESLRYFDEDDKGWRGSRKGYIRAYEELLEMFTAEAKRRLVR